MAGRSVTVCVCVNKVCGGSLDLSVADKNTHSAGQAGFRFWQFVTVRCTLEGSVSGTQEDYSQSIWNPNWLDVLTCTSWSFCVLLDSSMHINIKIKMMVFVICEKTVLTYSTSKPASLLLMSAVCPFSISPPYVEKILKIWLVKYVFILTLKHLCGSWSGLL